jgi:hypothetical protein
VWRAVAAASAYLPLQFLELRISLAHGGQLRVTDLGDDDVYLQGSRERDTRDIVGARTHVMAGLPT